MEIPVPILVSAHYGVLFVGLMFRKNDAAESRGQHDRRIFLRLRSTGPFNDAGQLKCTDLNDQRNGVRQHVGLEPSDLRQAAE